MITLGEFLGLIDNFYSENSVIKVFDAKKVADDSDCLADDTIGCVFGIVAGEARHFLTSVYENAEIVSVYIAEGQELRILIDTHSKENAEDIQADIINKRGDLKTGAENLNENSDSV